MTQSNESLTARADDTYPGVLQPQRGPSFICGGRGMDAAFSDYALARSVRYTYAELHAIAVSYLYEYYGRTTVGHGRHVWRANRMPPGRIEEEVVALIGDAPPRENLPHAI